MMMDVKKFINKNSWVWAAIGTIVIWAVISILSGQSLFQDTVPQYYSCDICVSSWPF